MASLVIRFVVMTVAVLVAGSIIPGFKVDSPVAAFVAAVILSLMNTFVRPLLILFTLPINIMTLGVFILIINAILVGATAKLVSGLSIPGGFGSAFLAALLISVVATFLNLLVKEKKDKN